MMWFRVVRAAFWVLLLVGLGACAETRLAVHAAKKTIRQAAPADLPRHPAKRPGMYKIGAPYQIDGAWYYPRANPDYNQTGIASWYGPQFHGRSTANGEIFDMYGLTAAHRTLPMPTRVRVTNLENGRSLIVRINDRGPFARGRIIDLSRRSAQLLGLEKQGTARVRVEALGRRKGGFTARKPVTTDEERTAVAAAPRTAVSAAPLPPPPGVVAAPPPTSDAVAGREVATAGQVDGAVLPPLEPAAAEVVESGVMSVVPVKPTTLFVQAGAFVEFVRANRLRAKLYGIGHPRVTSAFVDGTEYFRVRIGPLASVSEADRILDQVYARGEPGARIIVVD